MSMMEQQPFDFTTPPTHRRDDIDTAVAAGKQDHSVQRAAVLRTIRAAGFDGLTDDEVAARLDILNTSAGKRRLELQHRGLVEPTGTRGTTRTGSTAAKWRAVSRPMVVEP